MKIKIINNGFSVTINMASLPPQKNQTVKLERKERKTNETETNANCQAAKQEKPAAVTTAAAVRSESTEKRSISQQMRPRKPSGNQPVKSHFLWHEESGKGEFIQDVLRLRNYYFKYIFQLIISVSGADSRGLRSSSATTKSVRLRGNNGLDPMDLEERARTVSIQRWFIVANRRQEPRRGYCIVPAVIRYPTWRILNEWFGPSTNAVVNPKKKIFGWSHRFCASMDSLWPATKTSRLSYPARDRGVFFERI